MSEFFDIDLQEAEREKVALLELEMDKHKTHHCKLCGAYIADDNIKVCDNCASEYQF